MNFKNFIKDKIITIILLFFALISIEVFLIIYPFGNFIKIYIPICILGVYFISIILEYISKKSFYSNLYNLLNELDEKYLITELIKSPNFIEGKIFKDSLEQIDKSMIENVNKYKYLQEDYKEYIELWIHEIKLPIATSKMIVENNKSSVTKSINEELDKVENYVEQALFYARSNTVEKDYYIKSTNLKDIVNECIKKNKNILIQEKIKINIFDLDVNVNTDIKWVIFILNQIIQNCTKYIKKDIISEIRIYTKTKKENVVLYIEDNGIGIMKGEVTRVFEKGFTGTNGRISNKKSTGIGLYLCKKMCDKLGLNIELNSIQNEGTEVRIVFPKNSFTEFD
ncbi:MAG: HAMP domain-containing histidine kinase [Clostridia bacterium]|nr:HAMP domain-containing histidine kinase [Clostridia bacterium]